MKHFAAAALLLAGLVLAAAPAQAAEYNNTALNLLWDCDDDPQTGQSDQIFCHGYMTGFIEGYREGGGRVAFG